MRPHCNLPSRTIQRALLRRALILAAGWPLVCGCFGRTAYLRELSAGDGVAVVLDANARAVVPGLKVKFYVDITNRTETSLDLSDLNVELRVSPAGKPETITLRKSWKYDWGRSVILAPGKRLTVPIVPEARRAAWSGAGRAAGETVTISELPLENLHPGDYEIRASVNDRFISPPYRIAVHRPELRWR